MTTVAGGTLGVMVRDDETAPFFDAANDGRLVVQRCNGCGNLQFPQPFTPGTHRCHACHGADLSWQPVSGQARLVTWTALQGRPAPDGTPAPITVVGVLELDEGPWVHAQLRQVDLAALAAGQGMAVSFERPVGGEPLPVFLPR